MDLRLPPIRNLHLSQCDHPRDEHLAKVLAHCQVLCAFADHYASAAPSPDQSEVADMVDRAVEVIDTLQEYRRASYPSPTPAPAPLPAPVVAHPPKRPWEDTVDDGRRVAPSPPADRSLPGSSSAGAQSIPSAQEAHMHVFDGVPERTALFDNSAKAVAARDMEDIRAHRAAGQAAQRKVKYKKRSRASPPGKCHSCEILDTPEWRRGPDGQRTLCNACGLHYAKLVRRRDNIISSLPAGGPMPPPIDIAYLRRSARLAAENSALARSASRRRAAGEAKATASKGESSKRGSNAEGGAGRKGRGHPEQQNAESTPAQNSFPRTQTTSPYPPLPSMPQIRPNHASSTHATSPLQSTNLSPLATSLPPLASMNTLPSTHQSYPPLVPSYPTPPHSGSYPPSYAPPYRVQPSYGLPPHGYPQQPGMPGLMSPSPPPGSWDHYVPGNNSHEPHA
ncbi:hypothetical protein FS749_004442 [Ceratobasidium sp. UAMH 11750]|nr:hypothetical protein FS749_004442 [Ceratobasidium sp. UAMH 11750]